jgi:hypothetical protein
MGAKDWRKAGVYLLVVVPVLGLGGITLIAEQRAADAQQESDPVADAARKAREQKKEAPKPKKVYTNDNFGSGSGSSAQAATPAATSSPTATPAGDAKDASNATTATTGDAAADAKTGDAKKPAADKNDEATWRKKFSEARQSLADAEKELDILQREAQKAQVQYYSDPAKAMTEGYSRKDVNEKDTKIAAKKQEIEQLKQHLADMEDQLRKSGGDIGWAR